MKAVVDKAFDGAPDGEIYPRHFKPGQLVEGDLARIAVEQGWASIGERQAGPGKPAVPVVIPAGWETFNATDTIALARQLGADEGIRTKAAGADFIRAEAEKRGAGEGEG
jgi:hypothetical protein